MLYSTVISESLKNFSLEDWMQNPLEHTEWVNGELVEKTA
ncbi:hypothetical protein RIVM261_090570 [Rivularia sp. IAM M-261]|nr:hypothetical protein RIVM261_090570 [Rivularia sp. IAM M-261]